MIKKLNEISKLNEIALKQELNAQFDIMQDGIRSLKKERNGGIENLSSYEYKPTKIDEVGVISLLDMLEKFSQKKIENEVAVSTITNETVDIKVKMYNNAISIKEVSVELKKLQAKKTRRNETIAKNEKTLEELKIKHRAVES